MTHVLRLAEVILPAPSPESLRTALSPAPVRPACVPADWTYLGDGQWASPFDAWGCREVVHPSSDAPKVPSPRHLVVSAGERKTAVEERTRLPVDWDAYDLALWGKTGEMMEREFLAMTEDPAYARLYRPAHAASFSAFMTSRRASVDD